MSDNQSSLNENNQIFTYDNNNNNNNNNNNYDIENNNSNNNLINYNNYKNSNNNQNYYNSGNTYLNPNSINNSTYSCFNENNNNQIINKDIIVSNLNYNKSLNKNNISFEDLSSIKDNNCVLNSTQFFMKTVDISCEDHKNKHNISNINAVRYCKACKVLVCSDCVIEFHYSHINEAKTKIEDYFSNLKNELESIKFSNTSDLQKKKCLDSLVCDKNELLKEVDCYYNSQQLTISKIKIEIEKIQIEIENLKIKTKENINNFYDLECIKNIEMPLNNLENCKYFNIIKIN